MIRCDANLRAARLLTLVCLGAIGAPRVMAQTNSAAAYTFTTLAGYSLSGSADGLGPEARFSGPAGVAVATDGNTYVTDKENATIRKITPAGVVSTIAGLAGYRGVDDGLNTSARFWSPQGITTDTNGNVYVTDPEFFTIRKLTPSGTNWVVSTIAGQLGTQGYRDGGGLGARFTGPFGIAADSAGNIYVADVAIRKVTLVSNEWVVSTVANSAGYVIIKSNPGPDTTNIVAVFTGTATDIAVDGLGNLYVADQINQTISQLSPAGTNWIVKTIAGLAGVSGSADGSGAVARFKNPAGIAADSLGFLSVADGNNTIRKLSPDGTNWIVSTLAGSTGTNGSTDGVGTNASFFIPLGVAFDGANNLLVADRGNNEIRKVTSAGVVGTFAGSSATGAGSTDGIGTIARFHDPEALALDGAGNVYVSDTGNCTIRRITPVGIVSTIAGLAGYAGTVDGIGSNARLNFPNGIAVDNAGNLYVIQQADGALRKVTPAGVVSTIPGVTGTDVAVDHAGNVFLVGNNGVQKVSLAGTNWVVSNIATVPGTPTSIAAANDGRLFVILNGNQLQMLTPTGSNWVVSSSVTLEVSPYHIAVDGADNIYVPGVNSHTVLRATPAGTNWLISTIGGSSGTEFGNGGNRDGAGANALFAIPLGVVADFAGNVYVSDGANQNIRKGVFTAYTATNPVPYTHPPMNAQLVVNLTPPEANGQWRFPWELGWRNAGTAATNLVAGNYPVEFRPVPGWLPIPPRVTVAVTNNGATPLAGQYYPTVTSAGANGGTLTVNIGPSPPSGAGWRFLGENTPFLPPGYTTNVLPGTYLIEFAPVAGRSRPPNLAVQVFAGLPTVLTENYLVAGSPPLGVELPFPVPIANLNDLMDYPFGFAGQLQSDVGSGSGVAVQAEVVLTAAHLVFNDQALAYASQAYWFFQKEAGSFAPLPLAARGWYLLSGYAAQRTNDLQSGLYAPDQSTPQSRNMDVAALYFLDPVAGGGYGGYLPSDSSPNSWLSGSSLKMLAGYPVDGSLFADATIVPGQMYQTTPQPYPLSLAADPVANQQIYTANWFLSYPGNSGGPFYVQFNGYYYPAGVYLGTLYNGAQPYASAVRAIDSDVVNLITLAATQGDTGTNHTGGGVITIIPNQNISANTPGYVQFQLAPPAAVQQGAAWRLQGDSSYSTTARYTRAVISTNAFAVEFKPIPGWNLPTNQTTTILPGLLITNVAFYKVTNPVLVANPAIGLGITGTTGTTYRIESRISLSSGTWTPLSTNLIVTSGFNSVLPTLPTNGPGTFYRALWLP